VGRNPSRAEFSVHHSLTVETTPGPEADSSAIEHHGAMNQALSNWKGKATAPV
jgi:hypothetical protein